MKTNQIIRAFLNLRRLALFAFILFFSLQLSGNPKNPALIPMPQKVVWNESNFKKDGKKQRILERIVFKIPEAIINQDEAYMLKVNSDSVVLTATTKMGLFRGVRRLGNLPL